MTGGIPQKYEVPMAIGLLSFNQKDKVMIEANLKP
jgi:hypothetical protein